MTVTAENIRDDVIKNLAGRTDISDTMLYRQIHYAQTRVARLKAFNELNAQEEINTVADQRDYTFPNTLDARRVRKIDSILPEKNSDSSYERTLVRVPTIKMWNEMLSGRDVADTSRTPTHYLWRLVNQLSLEPIPDVVYVLHIDYTLYPVEVTETNKANELSLYNADDLIMALTTAMLHFKIGREKQGTTWFNIYRGSVKEMVEEEQDYSDFDMSAIKREFAINSPSNYWADPFYRQAGTEQV